MSTKWKIVLGLVIWWGGTVVLLLLFGSHGRNNGYSPQDEFKLHTWVDLGTFSINQAVLYLVLAGTLTCVTMIWIAHRMQQRPNRVQTLVEVIYQGLRHNIVGTNMDRRMASRWFPFVATLALFIWYSNVIGFIPLPTATDRTIDIFGVHVPAFSLYAATANLSIPLALAIVVFVSYTVEGIRAKGPLGYLRGLIPGA